MFYFLTKNLSKLIVLGFVVSILGGCATGSMFISYPAQIQPIKIQLENMDYKKAQMALGEYQNDADKILYLSERARVSQLANDTRTSIEDFKKVIAAFKKNDDKAKVTLSGAAAKGASLLTNDNVIPYEGDGYERIFVYQFQAMNYLMSGNLDAAMVEVRRAGQEQQTELQRFEDEVIKAEEDASKEDNKNKDFMDSFTALQTSAGQVKNSFQNAYTFYVSGVLFEAAGYNNDAYIDYKKALEIFPGNVYVQMDVLRLAKSLGMREDYLRFNKEFKGDSSPLSTGEGEIVVLFEQGFVPVKMDIKIPLYIDGGLRSVAFPTYYSEVKATTLLSVSISGGKTIGVTSPIVNVQALAAKALLERLPGIMIRQVLRLFAKDQTRKQAEQAFGDYGRLAADVFNIVSEQADRRSWLTLPNDAQILRSRLPKGQYKLQLKNGNASGIMDINVVSGRKTVIRVVNTGNTFHTTSIVL